MHFQSSLIFPNGNSAPTEQLPIAPSCSPWHPPLYFLSANFTTPEASDEWDTVFILLCVWLIYLNNRSSGSIHTVVQEVSNSFVAHRTFLLLGGAPDIILVHSIFLWAYWTRFWLGGSGCSEKKSPCGEGNSEGPTSLRGQSSILEKVGKERAPPEHAKTGQFNLHLPKPLKRKAYPERE